MEITLATHYGFCQGVKNAINIVNNINHDNKPIYMLNKLVHNNNVCEQFINNGIIILDDDRSLEEKINSINEGTIIFSAHGHDKKLNTLAKNKNLNIIDTTCPKVILNEKSIIKALNENKTVIYIGIKKHPETIASLSISNKIIFLDFFKPDYSLIENLDNVSVHNQTTLIQDDLKKINDVLIKKIKHIEIHNDICFATTLRQKCFDQITDEDVIFVIGDKISSNSTRLYEVAKNKFKIDVYQISNLEEIKKLDLHKYKKGFITAGASTPDQVINPIIKYLTNY